MIQQLSELLPKLAELDPDRFVSSSADPESLGALQRKIQLAIVERGWLFGIDSTRDGKFYASVVCGELEGYILSEDQTDPLLALLKAYLEAIELSRRGL